MMTCAGMHLARNRADPGFKRRGAAGGPKLVAFTSEQAHYSYEKAAALTGLGTNNLIRVPCTHDGAISVPGTRGMLMH
jgi:glutamate/tyrosine decarboxylase-like PLP-dependent enzyme